MNAETLSLFDIFFRISWVTMFLTMVFYVLFGQITVRKLRKNSTTKDKLGLEFASGWDIINAAGALAMPSWINKNLKNTPLSYLYADAEKLSENTTRFDRALAIIFYSLYIYTALSFISLVLLDFSGVFD